MRIFNFLLLLFVAMTMFIQCTSKEKQIHKELTKKAVELNRSTPVVLEQHTRFDSAAVTSQNVFQYYYTITNIDDPVELLKQQREEMILAMEEIYATDRSLQYFIQHEILMEYIYRDTLQNIIDVITIDTKEYKK